MIQVIVTEKTCRIMPKGFDITSHLTPKDKEKQRYAILDISRHH